MDFVVIRGIGKIWWNVDDKGPIKSWLFCVQITCLYFIMIRLTFVQQKTILHHGKSYITTCLYVLEFQFYGKCNWLSIPLAAFTRYPKILLKGNKEINLDISEPKHWSKYHEMSSTENSNILQLTKIDKEACYNSCEFKEP